MALTFIEKNYVKNVYDNIAPHFSGKRIYTWKWILNFINSLQTNSIIYDIGCGNGRNMNFKEHTFIGIDNCKKFVEICKNNGYLVLESSMLQINLPDNSADAILSIASFHHLSTKDNRIKALNEMKRLLKNNGKILLSVWSINQPSKTRIIFNKFGDNMVKWDKSHLRYYYIFQLIELIYLFQNVGLIILDYNYECGNEVFILTKNNS